MSISKDDVSLLGQSVEYKITLLDIKGTNETVTQALDILRTEFELFLSNDAVIS